MLQDKKEIYVYMNINIESVNWDHCFEMLSMDNICSFQIFSAGRCLLLASFLMNPYVIFILLLIVYLSVCLPDFRMLECLNSGGVFEMLTFVSLEYNIDNTELMLINLFFWFGLVWLVLIDIFCIPRVQHRSLQSWCLLIICYI